MQRNKTGISRTRIKKFLNRNYKKVPTKQSRSGYRKQFTTFKTRGPIYITNRVPYMAKLEGGHSKQNALFVKRASDEISRKLLEERDDCQDFGKDFKKNAQYIKVLEEKIRASFSGHTTPKPEGATSKHIKKDTKYVDKTEDIIIDEDEAEFWKKYGAEFAIEQKKFEKGSKNLSKLLLSIRKTKPNNQRLTKKKFLQNYAQVLE